MGLLIKIIFFTALVVDAFALLFAVYLIVEDNTRFAGYPKNGGSGLVFVFLIMCGWVWGSYYLFRHDHKVLGTALAWVPALPVLLYGLFILMFLILKPDMK